ncbi:MAG: hypothetical protein ACXWO1_10690, partial [Isosphaeraceae bacterium]
LLGLEIERRDGSVVDIERAQHIALRVEGQPAAEVALAPDGSPPAIAPGVSPLAGQLRAVELESVNDVASASGPPDAIEPGRGRQPEPALADGLAVESQRRGCVLVRVFS